MCLFVGLGVWVCTICVQCPLRPEESVERVSLKLESQIGYKPVMGAGSPARVLCKNGQLS